MVGRNQWIKAVNHRPSGAGCVSASTRDNINTGQQPVRRCPTKRRMVSTSLFVLHSRPQKFMDHLLYVLFVLSHLVTYTLTINASTTAATSQNISATPADVMNTSSATHQVITSGSGTENLTNTTTTTTMSPPATATANNITVTYTLTINASTTAATSQNISATPADVMNTSSATHQVITSGSGTENLTNTTTTTTMSPPATATANNITVTYTLTINASTTAATSQNISATPADVMNTSSATHQVITSGSGTENLTNTTTTTTMSPPATATANNITAPWPVHCSFSQNCHSDSVYYWMTVNVEVNGSESNESDISAWLQNLFQNQNECSPAFPTVRPLKINTTSTSETKKDTAINGVSTSDPVTASVTQNISSFTTNLFYNGTLGNSSVSNGTESTNVFKDIKVMCANKSAIRQTTCTVLLQLTHPTNTCCIIQTVSTVPDKSSIQAYVVGDSVEQVVKGICHSVAVNPGPPVGSFEKCNGSLSPNIHCNSTDTVNVSCGNSETVYVSLYIGDQMNCTFENQPNTCNCISYCSSTAAYYSLDIGTTDFGFNMTQILTNPTCNITSFDCQALKNISQIYENYTVTCDIRCTIIVKLRKAIDVCLLSSALRSAFKNQSIIVHDGTVTRVAICSWENSTNADLLQPNILPVSDLLFDLCTVGKVKIVSNYCKNGTIIAVPLIEKCDMPVNSANVTNTTGSSSSAEATAEDLLNLSRNASSLNFIQIQQVVSLLESLISGPTVSLALGNMSINIVSNLINAPPNMLASISTRIIGIVDTVGLKLVVQGQSQSILSPSVALAVKRVDGALFPETTFTITGPFDLQIGPRLNRTDSSSPQGSITLPASLTANLTPQQQQLASRVQFNFYQKTTLFQDKALNPNISQLISGVLASSVANLSISNLTDQIVFTLKNTEIVECPHGNCSRSCVFWKFNLNDGSGGWSSKGCIVLNQSQAETICGCNHLTSFGVLLDLSREGINNRLQDNILTFITCIGCGISAIFLSITLMTYLAFETLRKDMPSKILIHLCLALLLLNLTFLLDAWLALYPNVVGLCISTAFFLHYFLLASFSWMAMEAVHMYLALVKVFNTYISLFIVKLGLAGWGIPLIVVIIVIAIDKNNYGMVSYGKFEDGTTDQFCWLKNDIAFYVAVVAYFCIVFLLSLSMFIVVMVQLCRIKRQNPHNLQHRRVLQDLRSVAGLSVLLGLTWGFAFFAWDAVNLPFMYLFAIFNSLQGFFIFVFHCAVKENVRRQWKIHFCCGKLRLVENSDWSHSATQRTKKSTINRLTSSFRSAKLSKSNNSSSSFLVNDSSGSDRSMGIGSPLDDRAITEQENPSLDVVLNEINHKYWSQKSI
ncbi:adhesion G-protein coupled receptor G4 isoform X2 [Tachysurus fulvidraco]|uniref:adhesion G-protein coupled receptor G4 isoform X2 n=1 Tax=Tachysurus fulvidraco TaxID=1234273 RepID=UPI001FEEE73F|nr:adhesion G-protein coupled receptor G4 isoform X2 [Tachysurus fulvidraco]